jgi:hypothetical protein
VDAFLGSGLVRWRARRYLDHVARPLVKVEYDREELANNGLSLTFRNSGSYAIRIRKADAGALPVPGTSKVMQAFYAQQLSFALGEAPANEVEDANTALNLVMLWEVTSAYRLKELRLVCPRSGGLTRESVQWHWDVTIPHPALAVEGQPPTEQVDDLDISLDEPEEGSGSDPAQ